MIINIYAYIYTYIIFNYIMYDDVKLLQGKVQGNHSYVNKVWQPYMYYQTYVGGLLDLVRISIVI